MTKEQILAHLETLKQEARTLSQELKDCDPSQMDDAAAGRFMDAWEKEIKQVDQEIKQWRSIVNKRKT